jgi:DNA-binding transcriptional LysR family regulator
MVECKPFVHDLETMAISTDMLQAFVSVAEQRSVSRAAAALGVGKSLVSKRVAQLEALVNATLFSRSTRMVALTAAGEAYLDHARRALEEMASAQERLRDLRLQLSGLIRVTAPVSWGQQVLGPSLAAFLRAHPAVDVELHLSDRLMDMAQERIDVALRWTPMVARDLHSQPVATVQWLLAAAPSYLAVHGYPEAPDDLKHHPCMSYWRESKDDAWTLVRSVGDDAPNAVAAAVAEVTTVTVGSRYHANDAYAVTQATLAGLGIGMLPSYLCQQAIDTGHLTRVLPAWTPRTKFGTCITAVAMPDRMRLARVQALLAFLTEALPDRPPSTSKK